MSRPTQRRRKDPFKRKLDDLGTAPPPPSPRSCETRQGRSSPWSPFSSVEGHSPPSPAVVTKRLCIQRLGHSATVERTSELGPSLPSRVRPTLPPLPRPRLDRKDTRDASGDLEEMGTTPFGVSRDVETPERSAVARRRVPSGPSVSPRVDLKLGS